MNKAETYRAIVNTIITIAFTIINAIIAWYDRSFVTILLLILINVLWVAFQFRGEQLIVRQLLINDKHGSIKSIDAVNEYFKSNLLPMVDEICKCTNYIQFLNMKSYERYYLLKCWLESSHFILDQLCENETFIPSLITDTVVSYRNRVIYKHEILTVIKALIDFYEKIISNDKSFDVSLKEFSVSERKALLIECKNIIVSLNNLLNSK